MKFSITAESFANTAKFLSRFSPKSLHYSALINTQEFNGRLRK